MKLFFIAVLSSLTAIGLLAATPSVSNVTLIQDDASQEVTISASSA